MSRTQGWQKQEDRIAKQVGGSVNAGSGAFDRKGDVRSRFFSIEAKWTGKKSYILKAETLEKILGEALAEGRSPLLQIELNGRCYAISEWDDALTYFPLVA